MNLTIWQRIWEIVCLRMSEGEKMDIQKVKDARNKGVVAFSRYCQEKKKYRDYLFCFFEGEDAKYYFPRIEKYSGYEYTKIIHYNCGGKKGVLKALNLVEKNRDEIYTAKAFFVDSDYDTTKYNNSLLYQTPCYSIENFYTSEKAFSKMLNREFGINTTEKDFSKCCSDYSKRQQEFHNSTIYINSWLACQRLHEEGIEENHKIVLSDFKISKLFSEIAIDSIVSKGEINREKIEELFPDSKKMEECEIEKKIEYFKQGGMGKLFRGKFEIEFLKKIIDSLKAKNKTGGYFSQKYTSVHIDPNINILSALADYADTPQCLIDFLKPYQVA